MAIVGEVYNIYNRNALLRKKWSNFNINFSILQNEIWAHIAQFCNKEFCTWYYMQVILGAQFHFLQLFFSFKQSRTCFLSFYGITVISTLGYHKSWVWFRGSMDFYFSPFRAFRRAAFITHEQLFLHKYKMNSYSWQVGN